MLRLVPVLTVHTNVTEEIMNNITGKIRTVFLVLGSILFILSFLLHSNKDVLIGTGMVIFLFYWILKYPMNKSSFILLMLTFGVLTSLVAISFGIDNRLLQGLSILLVGLLSLIIILKTTIVDSNFKFYAVFESMKKRSSVLIGLVFMTMTILLSLGYAEAGRIVGVGLIVIVAVGISVRLILRKREINKIE